MLLVLDRSGSMLYSFDKDCYCDEATARAQGMGGRNLNVCKETAGCTSRWASVSSALNVSVTATPYVRWGLKFFATPSQGECGVSSEVEVPVAEGNAAEIQAKILGTKPGNHTPTAAGVTKATAYLKALAGDNPKVILLATDGVPNCFDDNRKQSEDDSEATKAAIESAYQAGIPTYVIGIGPSTGNLDDFAEAGHTGKHYPATSPQALQDALNAIGTAVVSCTFTLNDTPPDPNNVAVYVDKNLVEKDDADGWSFGGDPKTIVLNGSVCEKVKGAKTATVQLLLGCKAPPTRIP